MYSQTLYWAGTLVLYSISMWMSFSNNMGEGLYRLLALNALLITANATFCISMDMWADSKLPVFAKALILSFVWIIVLKMGVTFFDGNLTDISTPKPDLRTIHFFYKTPIGVVLQHAVAILFSILSLKVYENRQTFLN